MKENSEYSQIRKLVLQQNLNRFFFMPLIAVPLFSIVAIYFYFHLDSQNPIEHSWRLRIMFSHISLSAVGSLMFLLSYFRKKYSKPGENITEILEITLLVLISLIAVLITLFDQTVTPAITPYIILILFISVSTLIQPLLSGILYSGTYLLMFFLLPFYQSNPDVVLSSRVNGLVITVLAYFFSILLWRNFKDRYKQGVIIENQRKELRQTNTELKNQAEHLQELNATKDKLFSVIAHDLKSPFTSIIGFSEILEKQADTLQRDEMKEYAGIIYTSAHKTLNLLVNLLDWAMIQKGSIQFNPEPVNFVEISTEAINLQIGNASKKGITLTNKILPNTFVYADRNMSGTILRNLISNAIKFTNRGGKIELHSEFLPNEVRFTVSDTGIGIPADDIAKLFKVGSNFSTTGTDEERGTGLGLILCKEFVEKNRGKIWVESDVGKGSSFFFTLPLSN